MTVHRATLPASTRRTIYLSDEHHSAALPVGSPEAWAAILRVRVALFGDDVSRESIVRYEPPRSTQAQRCADCGETFAASKFRSFCGGCRAIREREQKRLADQRRRAALRAQRMGATA